MAGRPESPLDPSAGPVERFASELRTLRARAGSPTYRLMARRTGQGASTLSQAAAGERLPTLTVVLAYVRACGADPAEWTRRWREAAAQTAARPRTDEDTEPPYRGLARFEPADAAMFFGRDELTERLLRHAASHRLTAVFGPSGSGKSSLLRAGLIPRLRGPDTPAPRPAAIRVLTPGEHPHRTHAERLEPAAADGDTWLIVDQFEELYTLCTDPLEREQFIDRLLTATEPARRLRVVLAVRADFLDRCTAHPRLTAALQDATVLAGPMSRDELREAVVRPAQKSGLVVERALTARVLEETRDEPGALPLMSHALLETWRRRSGRTLTLAAYELTGGVHGALNRTAEDLYARLTPQQAEAARRILLRLVTPGKGTQDTRRPAPRDELDTAAPTGTADVLERLVKARLVTLDGHTVTLAHEALIAAWPRLGKWIDEARERLRVRHRVTEAARAWEALGRDPGALYRGTPLAAAEEMLAGTAGDLNRLERDFLTGSAAARDREHRAAARTTRRLRHLTGALSVLLVCALTASLIAWHQYRASEHRRGQALAAQKTALSRQLAAQSAALLGDDPDLASLLAVQAYRTRPTAEAASSVYAAAALPLRHRLGGPTAPVSAVAFSPDGRRVAAGGVDGALRLRDTRTGTVRRVLPAFGGAVTGLAYGAGGRLVAAGAPDGTIRVADLVRGTTRLVRPTGIGPLTSMSLSPDGRLLAAGGLSGRTELVDTATGRLRARLTGHTEPVRTVTFSPDGRTVATGGDDRTARLWDTATGENRAVLTGHADSVSAMAFSPDGTTLATGSRDRTVRLWDVAQEIPDVVRAGPATVSSMAFTADGRTLATGEADGTARLWDAAGTRPRGARSLGTGAVTSLLPGPGGRMRAALIGADGRTVRLRDANDRAPRTVTDPGPRPDTLLATALGPGGRVLATGGTGGTVRLWDTATGRRRILLTGHTDVVTALAFSRDAHTVVSAGADGTVRLWDTATGASRAVLDDTASSVALSPDGRTLATGHDDGTVRLWDLATRSVRATLRGPRLAVSALAISPGRPTLAAGTTDGTIRRWHLYLPRPPQAVDGICRALHRDLTPRERTRYLKGRPRPQGCPPVT
ncbi:hypothetical protein ABT298_38130 [Streptomyces sp. NPDC001034]|uniref:nSTAND1 domain-containing NTPase n=1 Tax=Streptomyces sp. NPDC001034 TaxID=3154375 RepID=UPI003316EA0B